jgi:hypothetical protein
MNSTQDFNLGEEGWRRVGTSSWLYDGLVPTKIAIWARPAYLASSRFDDDDQLDEVIPIPETKDGFLYCCWPGEEAANCLLSKTPKLLRMRSLGAPSNGTNFPQ